MKYFTSDLHLGHKTILTLDKSNRFASMEERNETIINNMFSIPGGSDLYILGDLAWYKDNLQEFLLRKPHNIHVHLIMGNHDNRIQHLYNVRGFTTVQETKWLSKEQLFLCHYPMIAWNRSHANSTQLFGHIHVGTPQPKNLCKQINVNCEYWNYMPLSFDQIVEVAKTLPDNWDYVELQEMKKQ